MLGLFLVLAVGAHAAWTGLVPNPLFDRMEAGRLVEQGDTEAVYAAPRHPYTAALLSANPEPDPDLARDRITLPAEVPSLMARPGGCEFHTRCPWVQDDCRERAPALTTEGDRRFTCHHPLEPGARPPQREALLDA